MKVYTQAFAEENLEKLIDLLLSGERVVISHEGKEAVELVQISKERRLGILEGKLTMQGTWEEIDKEVEDMFDEHIYPDEE